MCLLVVGALLVTMSIGLGGAPGTFAMFLAAGVSVRGGARATEPDSRRSRRRRRRRLAAGLSVLLFAGIAVPDAIFGLRLAHRYGAASVVGPALAPALILIVGARVTPRLPSAARRLMDVAGWLAGCALGTLLVLGIPSRHDAQFGGCILGFAIGSLDIVWAPIRRVADARWRRARRVLMLAIGDWENDVGFLGDGRGRRRREQRELTDAVTRTVVEE